MDLENFVRVFSLRAVQVCEHARESWGRSARVFYFHSRTEFAVNLVLNTCNDKSGGRGYVRSGRGMKQAGILQIVHFHGFAINIVVIAYVNTSSPHNASPFLPERWSKHFFKRCCPQY